MLAALGDRCAVTTRLEHASVLEPLKVLARHGIAVETARNDDAGRVDLSHLEELLAGEELVRAPADGGDLLAPALLGAAGVTMINDFLEDLIVEVQGYLFSKPLDTNTATRLLASPIQYSSTYVM